MFGNLPKLTVGRIRAIPIRADITFLLIPYLLLKGLSGRPIADHWPQFLAVAAGIFISILLHELGHALTAKRYRVGVVEVVVGGFYGYARMQSAAISRIRAISILAAGPVTNLVLFVVFWLALSTPTLSQLGVLGLRWPPGQSFLWLTETMRVLALLNLLMFVFNLFPFYPLDGGKIFGLILDKFTSLRVSLAVVSALGITAGAAMVIYGFGSNTVLAIIGAFVIMTNVQRLSHLKAR